MFSYDDITLMLFFRKAPLFWNEFESMRSNDELLPSLDEFKMLGEALRFLRASLFFLFIEDPKGPVK